MTCKGIAQTNQQQKSEKPQVSNILQRAAVRSVSKAGGQSTDDLEAQPLGNSAFSKDFSRVPISTSLSPLSSDTVMVKERVQKPLWQPSIQKKQSRIVPPIDNQTERDALPSPKMQPSRLPSKAERDALRRSLFEKWAGATPQQESEVGPREEASAAKGKTGIDIQAKLIIGKPGNKYEQEADRVAARVVNEIIVPAPLQSVQNQNVQLEAKQEEEEELQMKSEVGVIQREEMLEEEELQMKSMVQLQSKVGGMTVTPDLETSIQQARGSGQPLAERIRKPMEQAFGADFSGVRVHADTQADQLNQSIQAKAFTTGHDVFFRQGAYDPGSQHGQELIAHELTHVVQQNRGTVQRMEEKETHKLEMGEGKAEDLRKYVLYSNKFISCSPVVMFNTETKRGALFHFPAKDIKNENVRTTLKDLYEQVKPDEIHLNKRVYESPFGSAASVDNTEEIDDLSKYFTEELKFAKNGFHNIEGTSPEFYVTLLAGDRLHIGGHPDDEP